MKAAQGVRRDRAGLGCGEGILKFVEGDQGAHTCSKWGWKGPRRKLFLKLENKKRNYHQQKAIEESKRFEDMKDLK
jgi:hypothetical protein